MSQPASSHWPACRRETIYATRVTSCFVDRAATLDDVFRAAVARAPTRVAVADDSRRLTYRELDTAVDAFAARLGDLGFVKGDRLALLIGNRVEFLIAVLACIRQGVIVVPLGTRQTAVEVTSVVTRCGALGLVYDPVFADSLPTEVATLRHMIVTDGPAPAGVIEFFDSTDGFTPKPGARPRIAPEDTFCLLYTSGTTGRPKGACLTHVGAIHSLLHFRSGMALADGEVSVLAVPASHVTGLIAILLTMIEVAGTTVMLREFKARRFIECAAAERMTHALLVPAMYNLCLLDPGFRAADLGAWRVGGFGGAPMPEATIARLADALPALRLVNAYGATETTSPATMMPPGAAAGHADSVGRVLPCAEIVVMDADGREVAPGEAGELWIAGPMVVPCYWDDPDADRAAFVAGYWRSGDIGSIDADGFVRILDRRKDVINRGGYKVYSIEVENVIAQHPGVVEVAVVPRPDPVLGQRVHAHVVVNDMAVDEAALRARCARVLSDYKVPSSFEVGIEPLPRNANGKVVKAKVGA